MVRFAVIAACLALVVTGCGPTSEPATDRTIVGTWELDTRSMTDEALRQVELRLREQARAARPAARPPAEGNAAEGNAAGEPAAQPAANTEAAGPSPTEINAEKEKERKRLAGTFATLTIKPDGSYLAEYRTDIDSKQTRRVVIGQWTLASGVLVLKETEVMLDSEGGTGLGSLRFEAERSRLASITLRGTPPSGVQQVFRRR